MDNKEGVQVLSAKVQALSSELSELKKEVFRLNGLVKMLCEDKASDGQILGDVVLDHCIPDSEELSTRTLNCLRRANIKTFRDFLYVTKDDIAHVRNLGQVGLEETMRFVNGYGLKLPTLPSEPVFEVGSIVVLRVDVVWCGKLYQRGGTFVIEDVDTKRGGIFSLTKYTCSDGMDGSFYVSPGMIKMKDFVENAS